MNHYREYKNARNLAWHILINHNIKELPINVSRICRKEGITVKLFSPQEGESDGKSFITPYGKVYIFVSNQIPIQRQRFTAAHELGHVLLGHLGKYKLVNREPSPADNPIEREANIFASRLLAPACVLHGCNVQTVQDIMDLCHISRQAAEFRALRMDELRKRNKFFLSPLERQVFDNFKDYIETHKL